MRVRIHIYYLCLHWLLLTAKGLVFVIIVYPAMDPSHGCCRVRAVAKVHIHGPRPYDLSRDCSHQRIRRGLIPETIGSMLDP